MASFRTTTSRRLLTYGVVFSVLWERKIRLMVLELFITISGNFVRACKSRKGMAHFGVLLHYIKDYGWIGDFGRRILEEALRMFGDECDWARWARGEVCHARCGLWMDAMIKRMLSAIISRSTD